MSAPKAQNDSHRHESVGSLLLPSTDLQELSSSPKSPGLVNLKKRVTVGSLLVQSSDLNTRHQDASASGSTVTSLRRRISENLKGPPPCDSDAACWADYYAFEADN